MYVQRSAIIPITDTRFLLELLVEHHSDCCLTCTCDHPTGSYYATDEIRVPRKHTWTQLLEIARNQFLELHADLPHGVSGINRAFGRKAAQAPLAQLHSLHTDQPTML